jgi:GNAT superfamily N-acetyltransferase
VQVRAAQPGDVEAIRSLVARAYEHYVPRIGRRPAPMDDDYAERVRAEEAWVLEDGSALVGVLVAEPVAHHLLVENVAVAPERQGEGLGRRLLGVAEDHARTLGLPEMRLLTNAAMTENVALYTSLGWEEYDRRGDDGFRRVHFRKPVSPAL